MVKQVICGVDIGSWTFKICASDWKTFEILTNQANFRETPSLISYTQSERLIGEQAVNKMKSNYLNTIRAPMRLIGLQQSYSLIQEELKGATSRFEIQDSLQFHIVNDQQKKKKVLPEELLVALMGKIKKIISLHDMQAEIIYFTVPSYLSQYERKLIKKCGQVSDVGKTIRIIDDWISIATQYSFNRVKELNAIVTPRVVLFLDVGYSKTSIFVIEFTAKETHLLDVEHLRFVGAKNMDHLIAQYYDNQFKRKEKSTQSLFSMSKSMVKLHDSIEKQRKVLSANSDHQLNIQSLINDTDFTYSMKREQFQDIIFPALSQICQSLTFIRNRMPQKVKLHSIQLLGGSSRIPYFKSLIYDIFQIEPSKTLNQSEAVAHGTAIYGAKDQSLFYYDYTVNNVNLVDVSACWNNSGNGIYLGQEERQYKFKEVIFGINCKVPNQKTISFGNEGPIEMYIYYSQNISKKSIGYVRFQTPNKVRFILDSNKIISAILQNSTFDVYKFYEKKQEKWMQLKVRQQELVKHEDRLRKIYELKNEYQAKLYAFKNKIGEYKQLMNEAELRIIDRDLLNCEEWIEKQHSRVVGSEQDIHLYTFKIQEINSIPIFNNLQARKQSRNNLICKYQMIKKDIQIVSLSVQNELKARKLHFLLRWLVQSYENMKETRWEGYYLTQNSLQFAAQELERILRM